MIVNVTGNDKDVLLLIFFAVRLTRTDRRLLAECSSDIDAVNGLSVVLRWSEGTFGIRSYYGKD